MRARQIIFGAKYSPEALSILFQAFEQAWEKVAPHFGDQARTVDAARIKLARIVLGLATGKRNLDVDRLVKAALEEMALDQGSQSSN